MAEDGSVTPEKQLLKLIEEAKGGDLPGTAGPKKSGRIFAPRQWIGSALGRLAFWKRSAKKRAVAPKKFKWSMETLNRLLGLAVAAAFAYLVWDVGSSAVALRHPPNFALQSEKAAAGAGQEMASLKDAGFYLQQISARDIFQDESKAVKRKQKQEEGKKPSVIIEEQQKNLAEDFALVGISWSSNPDAIIEDKVSRRTHFVKKGSTIGAGIKVEAIFKDKVVLSFEGEEFELR